MQNKCTHPDHPIKLFCQTCNQIFCYECLDFHYGHNTKKYEKKDFHSVLQDMNKVYEDLRYNFGIQKQIVDSLQNFKGTTEELEALKKSFKFLEFSIGLKQFITDYQNFKSVFMAKPKEIEVNDRAFEVEKPPSNLPFEKTVTTQTPEKTKQTNSQGSAQLNPPKQNPIPLPPPITNQKRVPPPNVNEKKTENPNVSLEPITKPKASFAVYRGDDEPKIIEKKKIDLTQEDERPAKKKKVQLPWLDVFQKLIEYLPFSFFKEITCNPKMRSFDSLIYNSKEYKYEDFVKFVDTVESNSINSIALMYINEKKLDPSVQFRTKKEFLEIAQNYGNSVDETTERLEQASMKQIEDMLYSLSSSSLLKIQNDIFKTNNISYKDKSTMIKKILSFRNK